jgi:hypothetical protein
MTRPLERCLICCATPVAGHHVARAVNDPDWVVPLCDRCHGAALAWQWSLGVIRRETGTPAEREHAPVEVDWAQLTGVVIIFALAGSLPPDVWAAVQAVGAYSTHRAASGGDGVPFGPDPIRNDSHRRPPQGIGADDQVDWPAMFALIGEAADRLGIAAPMFSEFAHDAERIIAGIRELEASDCHEAALAALTTIQHRLGEAFRQVADQAADPSAIERILEPHISCIKLGLDSISAVRDQCPAETSADLVALARGVS